MEDINKLNAPWEQTTRSLRTHAITMGVLCPTPFNELLVPIIKRIPSNKPPITKDEYERAAKQQASATQLINLVCHAGTMASTSPSVSQEIYDLAKQTSETTPLDSDVLLTINQVMSQISTLCHQASIDLLSSLTAGGHAPA